MNCMLPEIAMKRFLRRRRREDIKDPQYIVDAQEAKRAKAADNEQRRRDSELRGVRGRGGRARASGGRRTPGAVTTPEHEATGSDTD